MFDNLFAYFGPMWASAVLFSIVALAFVGVATQTIRLALASRRPCLAGLRLLQLRRRVVRSWAVAGPPAWTAPLGARRAPRHR